MPAAPNEPAPTEPIHLRPEIGDLVRLVAYIENFALRNEIAHPDSHAFMLAAEELFANTLSHSYPRATAIEFSLSSDGVFASAIYIDDGSPFDPTSHPDADTAPPTEQRPSGGLGIPFIRRTMPTFHYQRSDGRNVITFGRPHSRRHSP
jgi:anti-sigma regulatory factor (Ser/Thr protein kinase)